MSLTLDTEACMFGWGPCVDSFMFSHSCKKREGHDGFHICEICGNRVSAASGTVKREDR